MSGNGYLFQVHGIPIRRQGYQWYEIFDDKTNRFVKGWGTTDRYYPSGLRDVSLYYEVGDSEVIVTYLRVRPAIVAKYSSEVDELAKLMFPVQVQGGSA